jgi:hydroxyacylglutathione hydrolase
MRISNSIYLAASGDMGFGLTDGADCNVYLIDCGRTKVLIDAGVGIDSSRILREMENDGLSYRDISHILLTHHHADHAGGAAFFKELLGCTIIAPAQEAESIEEANELVLGLDMARRAGYYPQDYSFRACRVDHPVRPCDSFIIGNIRFTVYDGSGHSMGGVCYYAEVDGYKSLFAGDLISHGGLISLQNIPGADLHNYARSVEALENLEVERLFPGHGCFSLSNGYSHIDKVIKAFKSLGIPRNAI